MAKKRISNQLWAQVKADFLAGASYKELEARYGILYKTIHRKSTVENWKQKKENRIIEQAKADAEIYTRSDNEAEIVRRLAIHGSSLDDIAIILNVSVPVLQKHYQKEIETSYIKAKNHLMDRVYKAATDPVKPSIDAAKLWLRETAEMAPAEGVTIKSQIEEAANIFAPLPPPKVTDNAKD